MIAQRTLPLLSGLFALLFSAVIGIVLLLPVTVQSAPPALAWPVECTQGKDCFIQQYVDHDPTLGAYDFRCASLSYDGHKGTDIRVPYVNDLDRGVAILAAASGVVLGTRNTMPDKLATSIDDPDIKGRECGNGVVIAHADGWETQYCHMQKGSIRVKKNDRVQTGTVLGFMGLSGATQFPHLHMSMRKDGAVVDPFYPDPPYPAARNRSTCGGRGKTSAIIRDLWAQPVVYQPGGIMGVGVASYLPDYDDIVQGRVPRSARLTKDSNALVLWTFAFGSRKGDKIKFTLLKENRVLFSNAIVIDKQQAQFYRAYGKKKPTRNDWPRGNYTGRIDFLRNGQAIDTNKIVFQIR